MEGKIFSQEYKISFNDCDRNYRLRPDTILAWAGEQAGEHLASNGVTREELWNKGQVFLLTRCVIKFENIPKYHEVISLNTWEQGLKGARFLRNYSITNNQGEILADCCSTWILVDPKTHQILRPKEYHGEFNPMGIPTNAKLNKLKFSTGEKQGEYTFLFTDIDANGHVNNGAYVRLAQNFAPKSFMDKPLDSLDISFIKEAMLGESIEIFTAELSEKSYQVYGKFTNGKISFESQITIK